MAVWPSSLYPGGPKSSSETMSCVKCTIPLSWAEAAVRRDGGPGSSLCGVTLARDARLSPHSLTQSHRDPAVSAHSLKQSSSDMLDYLQTLLTLSQRYVVSSQSLKHSQIYARVLGFSLTLYHRYVAVSADSSLRIREGHIKGLSKILTEKLDYLKTMSHTLTEMLTHLKSILHIFRNMQENLNILWHTLTDMLEYL